MLIFVFILLALACVSSPANAQTPSISPDAKRYLDRALSNVQNLSIHRKTVDWTALRDSANVWATGAMTTEATWPAIHRALRFVDPHSFLMTPRPMPPSAYRNAMPAGNAPPARPSFPATESTLSDRIGIIMVPGFGGNNRPAFVDSLQQSIREFDNAGACGWIVDLRFNPGGNMWPMLAGIGPLLGAQRVGAFVNANNNVVDWYYRDGQAWQGSLEPPIGPGIAGKASRTAHRLRKPDAPVALLFSRVTASSGEAVAVAFLGRPNLRTFGDSTAGFNSSNTNVSLPDGAQMVITNGMNRDRRGRAYALKIAPDELVPRTEGDDTDAPLERAKAWLLEQPHCSSAGGK